MKSKFFNSQILQDAFIGATTGIALYLANVSTDDSEQYKKAYGVNSMQASQMESASDKIGALAGSLGIFAGLTAFNRGRKKGKEEGEKESKRGREKIWTIGDVDFSRAVEAIHEDDFDKNDHSVSSVIYLSGPGVFLLEDTQKYYAFSGQGIFLRFPNMTKEDVQNAEPEEVKFIIENPPHIFQHYMDRKGKGINGFTHPEVFQTEKYAPSFV